MSGGPVDLTPDALRAIGLQELDKRIQGHADLVSIYLIWLQEHLNVWDLSDSAAFRPQIESWYTSLRFHGYQDQPIRDAFTAWVSNQIQTDPICARRLLVAEEELNQVCGGKPTMQPRDFGVDHGAAGVITVREDKVIDVSSGDDDSDVEFLGWKPPDILRSASKPARHPVAPLTGANKDTQRMQGAGVREPNDRLKRMETVNVSPIRVPSGRPHKNYVCDRCGERGHYKEQCPTNLDPSFDPRPTGGYQCYCCGAKEKHLTTLCPHNENPDSVTQQRIRAGVPVMISSSPLGEADCYRPLAMRPRKAKKPPPKSTDSASSHGIHRATSQIEECDDHRMDPARRARLERDDHEGSSPLSSGRRKGKKRSHYSPPRERRSRRSSKRVRRWREESRSGSRSSRSEREASAELLPRRGCRNSSDGRLSYWDDEYDDVKMSDMGSFPESGQPGSTVYEPSGNVKAEIQRLYPDAGPCWVSEMAGFDVDEFLDGLGDHELAAITLSSEGEEDARMGMDIFSDGHDRQALPPRVRLPPAPGALTESVSNRKGVSHDRRMETSVDDRSHADDTEEASHYVLQKDDKDRISDVNNRKIVVKLPQGGGEGLKLDRCRAQLEVNHGASPDPVVNSSS
ncbi:hypothetical protein KVR01_002199 [Diaporthe batatas]|uniref:uncharacterized protein n=1 Tax=Diaporthe batatas TaxID=748121 RepID=UPI001D04BCC6|nr:uncharacterized protein KVR01_002199 [Diaporthe batatas]KAG8166510.1 hypothetical protein KVR01_002199 [Diaporthe batatas]